MPGFTLPLSFFRQDSTASASYTVTYSIAPDIGTFTGPAGATITADSISFSTNNTDIITDCASVTITPDLDEYRDTVVTLTITDGVKTKTVTRIINGNSAFSVSNLNQTVSTTEDVNPTITTMVVTDNSDTSATGDVTVTITNSNTSAATLSSSAGTYNSTTGVYTLTDSIANVNTALAALSVSLTANFNGDFVLTTAFNDTGNVHTASGEIDIAVSSVNDAPVWSNVIDYNYSDLATTFNFNGPDVADADNDVITVTAALQDSIGTLSSSEPGVTQNNNQTLIANGLPATVNNVLDNLTFNRTGTGQSSIIFYANDGTANVSATSNLFYSESISANILSTSTLNVSNLTTISVLVPDTITSSSTVTPIIKKEIPLGSAQISSTSSMSGPTTIFVEHQFSANLTPSSSVSLPKITGTYTLGANLTPSSSVSAEIALQNVNLSASISSTSDTSSDLSVFTITPFDTVAIDSSSTVDCVQVRPVTFEEFSGISMTSTSSASMDEFVRTYLTTVSDGLDQIDEHFNTYEITTGGLSKKLYQTDNTYATATSLGISNMTSPTSINYLSVANDGNHVAIKFPDYNSGSLYGKVEIYNGVGATDDASDYSLNTTFTSSDSNASNPFPNRVMAMRDDKIVITHDDGTTHRYYTATKSGGSWSALSAGATISDLGTNVRYAVSPDGSKFVQVANTTSSTTLEYYVNGVSTGTIATSNLPSSGTNYVIDSVRVLDDGTIYANAQATGEIVRMSGGSSISVTERIAHDVTTGISLQPISFQVSDDGRYMIINIQDDSPAETYLQVYFKGTGSSSYTKISEQTFSDLRNLSPVANGTIRIQDANLNAVLATIPSVGNVLHK